MKSFLIFTTMFLAAASGAFAQDTTGGTRPNFIIPLHKTKTAAVQEPDADKLGTYNPTETPTPVVKPKKAKKHKHPVTTTN